MDSIKSYLSKAKIQFALLLLILLLGVVNLFNSVPLETNEGEEYARGMLILFFALYAIIFFLIYSAKSKNRVFTLHLWIASVFYILASFKFDLIIVLPAFYILIAFSTAKERSN